MESALQKHQHGLEGKTVATVDRDSNMSSLTFGSILLTFTDGTRLVLEGKTYLILPNERTRPSAAVQPAIHPRNWPIY